MSLFKRILLIACFSLLIIGCSRVSQSNYDKIKPQMTMEEVVAILGEPTESESVNIAGVSGTAANWKGSHAEINIQFINNQVAVKTFSNLDKKQD